MLTKAEKEKIVKEFAISKTDTGSPEVQIALLTAKINKLTDHFKAHKKDLHSKRGFIKMIRNRTRLLNFLKKESEERYNALIKKLNLRK